ncbi:acyltransferase family protein [Kitasatospora purpeofusca]|uniref:acyltransferase family protein n=1 Tax=Kitasatospora purpeofusca TaxID=67352 RepID=UPI00386B65D2|nr:acyltransferase family protein [Kitasatospora purpeofusca]
MRPAQGDTGGAAGTAAGSRLGWLDALRGFAALMVAFHHFEVVNILPPPIGGAIWWHFDFGLYGVMLFFVVSGYIIPASLERRGDVRAFWIGRIFRIYPALIVGIAVSIMILPEGDGAVAVFRTGHDLISVVANGTMLQDFLGVVNGLAVTWTLCYEMVFYFVVTALFTLNWHRRSGPIAVGLAAVALLFGTSIATMQLTGNIDQVRTLVAAAALVMLMGLACVLSGNAALTRTGALLLAGLGLVLVINNSRAPAFETWMIFATMFAGTVVHRAEHGQMERIQAWFCLGFVIVAGAAVGWLYNRNGMESSTWTAGWISWTASYLGAWLTFGVGMALRKRRFPKVLTLLGAISFSVYLLHNPILHTLRPLLGVPPLPTTGPGKLLWTAEFLLATVLASYLLYRLVEIPFQNLGRRVTKAVEARWPAQPLTPGGGSKPAGPGGTADPAGPAVRVPGPAVREPEPAVREPEAEPVAPGGTGVRA